MLTLQYRGIEVVVSYAPCPWSAGTLPADQAALAGNRRSEQHWSMGQSMRCGRRCVGRSVRYASSRWRTTVRATWMQSSRVGTCRCWRGWLPVMRQTSQVYVPW